MKSGDMRVLGIDPGYGRVGWAVLKGNRSVQEVVEWGCFETRKGMGRSRRLGMIYGEE